MIMIGQPKKTKRSDLHVVFCECVTAATVAKVATTCTANAITPTVTTPLHCYCSG